MDEDISCNNIPISNFKSNNIQNKERYIQNIDQMSPGRQVELNAPLSPSAAFAMRDNIFKNESQKQFFKNSAMFGNELAGQLSPRSEGKTNHCICGLPMRED